MLNALSRHLQGLVSMLSGGCSSVIFVSAVLNSGMPVLPVMLAEGKVHRSAGRPRAHADEPGNAKLRSDLGKLVADAASDFPRAKGARSWASEGQESYKSRLTLAVCSDPEIWKRPSGELEFTCQLVPHNKSKDAVYKSLDRLVTTLVAALPVGWSVERFPGAEPYLPVVVARNPEGRVELTASVTPYVDGTFSAGLCVTRLARPEEAPTPGEEDVVSP